MPDNRRPALPHCRNQARRAESRGLPSERRRLPALAMVFFCLYYKRSMRVEERALRRRFGVEYANWAAVTPKFLPRLSLWKRPQGSFSLGRVLHREHTALLTLVTCFTCLEIAGEWSITRHMSIDLEWASLFATTIVAYGLLIILKQRRCAGV